MRKATSWTTLKILKILTKTASVIFKDNRGGISLLLWEDNIRLRDSSEKSEFLTSYFAVSSESVNEL